MVDEAAAAAAKAPNDADAQYRLALASSYLAEVDSSCTTRKPPSRPPIRGIKAAEKAVALKPNDAENYRVLGTLYGQAITDLMSGLTYGPRAKDAIDKAVTLAPEIAAVYLARGVGNYYLPPQLGGGAAVAIADFRKAIELDSETPKPGSGWASPCARRIRTPRRGRRSPSRSRSTPIASGCKQQLEKTPAK